MLVTNKKYTDEAKAIATKVTELNRERHAKWLVNMKYVLDQSDVDATLSRQADFCESVIFNEKERVTDNQRLLLECESERVKERRKEQADRQNLYKFVVDDVGKYAEKLFLERLQNSDSYQLFNRFPDLSHFISIAYSPSLNFSKLATLTTNDKQLNDNVIALVNNPRFCSRLGKSSREIVDIKMAIGTLGIDNSRLLMPILMAKPLLKWHDNVTKSIAPKLWQHTILTANVSRLRMQQAGIKKPEQGIMLGILRTIGHFAIVNHFPQIFEDALIERMQHYRNNNMREEYYACAEVKPIMSVLPKAILKLEKTITRNIINELEWEPANIHLKLALEQDLDDLPILERNEHSIALAQAKTYSMFDGLDRSGVFVDKHKPFWFANVQMPPSALMEVRNSNPGKVELIK
ncbi:HDOD domain-containing protein [Vibrio sp. LaRot3]|uniref:HDOD domain-containing protein n=1 Tax=Vibrio sp. LaRot3 TaxID=2998829 RepID=UPI0022CDFEDA|nr:HDOD domain-containing protein [Vibrio sp. LaRot3]MDA0147535.1 HDOD domain-containing protein [Vibrio sp. LaRot3]